MYRRILLSFYPFILFTAAELACASHAVVLADASTAAWLACASHAVVLADA